MANKTCKTCRYGYADELQDIYCVNADSKNCTEYVGEDKTCDKWETKLSICPFCGSDKVYIINMGYKPNVWTIECLGCGASIGYFGSKEIAETTWNTRSKNMKLIYIAHPFSGKQENIDDVEKTIKALLGKYQDISFYSPLHATGFFYNEIPYLEGMEHCFEALSRCDELWLCKGWKRSIGCFMEYAYAKAKGMEIRYVELMGV